MPVPGVASGRSFAGGPTCGTAVSKLLLFLTFGRRVNLTAPGPLRLNGRESAVVSQRGAAQACGMKVTNVLSILRRDGWYQVAQRGSHRQLKHPTKPGRVTVPGKPSDDLAVGTLKEYSQASRTRGVSEMRYAVVIEEAAGNYSAYVPDLPGCVSTGRSLDEVERSIREAVEFHLQGLRADKQPIPRASSRVDYIEVAA